MGHTTNPERAIYRTSLSYWLNTLVFPLKMIVPQPVVQYIPGLTTNVDIRTQLVLNETSGRLLDIGCGPNRLVKTWRENGGEGTGVDVYPWEGVDTVVEDSSNLPFPEASFDTITLVASFNHIPNRVEVLHEARRLLAPGGRLILTNLPPFVSLLWHRYAFWDRDQHERGMIEGEVWGFTQEQMVELLEGAGFRVARFFSFSWRLNQLYICEPGSG